MRPRLFALDWSARQGARRKIWLAEVDNHFLLRLENGRDRAEVADHQVVGAGEALPPEEPRGERERDGSCQLLALP